MISAKRALILSTNQQNPFFFPCQQCGMPGRRKKVVDRWIPHAGLLNRPSWIHARIGIYKAGCNCCQYFQAPIPGVPYKGRYSYEVRNTIANSLIRDRMPYRSVIKRMQEDYCLENISLGYVHDCFLWAHQQINRQEYWQFVVANFSGILCIDEVHDSGRTILFASDPLNNFTVSFKIVEKNDKEQKNIWISFYRS